MSPVQFINHKGKHILNMDFSNISTEINHRVEKVEKFVEMHRPQSLLALVDFTGMRMDKGKIQIIKELTTHNSPYFKFIALVGLSFVRSITMRVMLSLSSRKNHKMFASRE